MQTKEMLRIFVEVGPPQEIGDLPEGRRRVIPITGGHFSGSGIDGEILPGGADWQVVRSDGLADIEARYTLRCRDGALIYVNNKGIRHAAPDVVAKLVAGIDVPPETYYFRTAPIFETAAPGLDWMRRHLFVAQGIRRPETVELVVHAVL